MNSILIAGGGTAGFITALILRVKLNKDIKIKMLVPKSIGIIGVGEGSTEHFDSFLKFINTDKTNFIIKTDATMKSGIRFKDWTKNEYMHALAAGFTDSTGLDTITFQHIMSNNIHPKYTTDYYTWNSLVGDFYDPYGNKLSYGGYNQFHFNTFKLNEHLTNLAKLYDIEIIDDEIVDVIIGEKGIEKLKGKKEEHKADFYIDSTGFNRVLISKLGAKWVSYSKYLKLKEAIAFPTEDEPEYNMYTVAQAMKYGWMWKIPVWGRHGNGYIYDTDYIDKEKAVEEVEKFLGKKIEVARHIKFTPGALDNVWIKNCVAVGLSANFIEPLEATSIGTSINQAFILMHTISSYNETTINSYNKTVRDMMENTRDFVSLHYITERNDTQFWKDVKHVEVSDKLKSYLEIWKNRLITTFDMSDGVYDLFHSNNFNQIAYAHNLINTENLKKHYKALDKVIVESALQLSWNSLLQSKVAKSVPYLNHKEYIEQMRKVKHHGLVMWELLEKPTVMENPFTSNKKWTEIINYDI